MKNPLKVVMLLLVAAGITFTSCKKDEAPALTLTSLKSGSADLYGAVSATGVSTSENIVAVFSTNVDATTANSTTITLMRGTTTVGTTITVSGNTVTIDPTDDLLTGDSYTLTINGVKSDQGEVLSAVITASFTTTGVGLGTPPQKDSQTMYLQFDGNITDLAGTAVSTLEQVSYTTDRFGRTSAAANFAGATAPGNGDIVTLSGGSFISPSITISYWFNIDVANYIAPGNKPILGIAAENGFFAEMGDGPAGPNWIKLATDHVVNPDPLSHGHATNWATYNGADVVGGSVLYAASIPTLDMVQNGWHQFVMTFDNTTYTKTFFIDGVKIEQWSTLDAANNEWNLADVALNTTVAGVDPVLTLGFFCSPSNTATGWADYSTATNTFKGSLDDMRIWSKALLETEVTSLYNSEKP